MVITIFSSTIRATSAKGFFFVYSIVVNAIKDVIVYMDHIKCCFCFDIFRFTVNAGPVSSIIISNKLNNENILKV